MGYIDLVKNLNKEVAATKRVTTEDRIAARKKSVQQIKDAIAKLQMKSKQATGSAVGKKKRRDAIAAQIRENKRKLEQHKEAIAKLQETIAKRRKPKETASSKYYVLVTRTMKSSPWEVSFGDYDRDSVKDEADSSGVSSGNRKILTVKSDAQADINAAVAELNK